MSKKNSLLNKSQLIKQIQYIINNHYSKLIKNTYLFLYLEDNNFNKPKYFEIKFDKGNFIHLTGIEFINNTLSKNNIYEIIKSNKFNKNFINNINYDLNKINNKTFLINKKISVMSDLFEIKNLTKIGKYTNKNNNHKLLAISDGIGNKNAYIGFDKEECSNYFYPKSILQKDIEKDCECSDILITLSKKRNENKYKNIVYRHPNLQLPSDFYSTLSSNLQAKIDNTILIKTPTDCIIQPTILIQKEHINLNVKLDSVKYDKIEQNII